MPSFTTPGATNEVHLTEFQNHEHNLENEEAAAAAVAAAEAAEAVEAGVDNYTAAIVAAAAASVEESGGVVIDPSVAAAAAVAAADGTTTAVDATADAMDAIATAATATAAMLAGGAVPSPVEDDDLPIGSLASTVLKASPSKKKRKRKPYIPALPPPKPVGYLKQKIGPMGFVVGADGSAAKKRKPYKNAPVPIPEQTEAEWMLCYYDLKMYYESYGNCRVPRKGYDLRPHLHAWGQKQKREGRAYREGKPSTMTPARLELLDRLGFEWHPEKGRSEWDERYRELLAFHAKYGKIRVPEKFDPRLHMWVAMQRRHYRFFVDGGPKQSNLDAHQVALLDAVGMEKRHRDRDTWENRFEELKQFKAETGHTNVPQKWKTNSALGRWVDTQKTQYHMLHKGKKTHLTIERIQQLIQLGFQWR